MRRACQNEHGPIKLFVSGAITTRCEKTPCVCTLITPPPGSVPHQYKPYRNGTTAAGITAPSRLAGGVTDRLCHRAARLNGRRDRASRRGGRFLNGAHLQRELLASPVSEAGRSACLFTWKNNQQAPCLNDKKITHALRCCCVIGYESAWVYPYRPDVPVLNTASVQSAGKLYTCGPRLTKWTNSASQALCGCCQ